jgi:hypothetical protein
MEQECNPLKSFGLWNRKSSAIHPRDSRQQARLSEPKHLLTPTRFRLERGNPHQTPASFSQ